MAFNYNLRNIIDKLEGYGIQAEVVHITDAIPIITLK
jgi:hypothetical protein